MEITLRDAVYSDIEKIIQVCSVTGNALDELKKYCDKYFTPDGKDKKVPTAQPDTILIAEFQERIVGYLHFWTDCYDGNENTLISLGTDPALSQEDAKKVKQILEEEFLLTEP